MNDSVCDPITAFDTLYTTNRLQVLKILLPHLQKDIQPGIAVYIKLNELLFSLRFSKGLKECSTTLSSEKETDMQALICEISPYLNGNEKEMLQKLGDLKDNMERFKQISQLMQMMDGSMENAPDSILKEFLTEEQIAMFKMFQEDLT